MARTVREVDLVTALAREIVLSVAPERMVDFDVYSEAFRQDPDAFRVGGRRGGPLGSGFATIVRDLHPMAFYLADAIREVLAEKAVEEVGDRGATWLLGRFRRSRKPAERIRIEPLTRLQLDAVHAAAMELTTNLGVAPELQQVIANAMVGYLARMPIPKADGKADSP